MSKQEQFIEAIATLVRYEFLRRQGGKWIIPSVAIAQAALESGWNVHAKTVFGIKGAGITLPTKEWNGQQYETVNASFLLYRDLAGSVKGYYDFLANTPRYVNALCKTDPKTVVYYLINTTDGAPYATDPDYQSKILSIVEKYNLQRFDYVKTFKNVEGVAREVIAGKYGNGETRKARLKDLGYDYDEVQSCVNQILKGDTKYAGDDVVNAVIRGEYGNGAIRRQRLEAAGFDYDSVQKAVNKKLKGV